MKNIFTRQNAPTIKLASSYLIIIMVMSIISSLVFYSTSARELSRKPDAEYYSQTNFKDPDHELDEWLGRRANAGRDSLLINLLAINGVVLLGGSVFSYGLACRTLKPIEEAMQVQSRFIADASHELRTPLTAILLSNEMALRRKQLSSNDARNVILQNIEDINRLKTLSDELLDLTDVSHANPQLVATGVQDIVNAAVDRVRASADEKKIKIDIRTEKFAVRTDKQMLEKILVILLDNAIKYSQEGGSISIFTEHSGEHVLLHVQDHGPGIRKEDMPHIFDRFYRANDLRSQVEGHGLGLAIAKQIADDLHCVINVDSVYESGSIFTVKLPAR